MALSNLPVFAQQPAAGVAQILNADGTAKKTVVTGGANGSKVVALMCASTDTSQRFVQVTLTRGATSYNLLATVVPAASGTDVTAGTTPNVNLLANIPGLPMDNDGQRYLYLTNGDLLQVNSSAAITAAKQLDFIATYADF